MSTASHFTSSSSESNFMESSDDTRGSGDLYLSRTLFPTPRSQQRLSKSPIRGLIMGSTKYGKECICGRGEECQGVTSAFALLGDARRGYIQLPPLLVNPETTFEREQCNVRAAYLRHLSKDNALVDLLKNQSDQFDNNMRFVALHHFHPTVVETHSSKKKGKSPIPLTLKPIDVDFLHLKGELTEADRVSDEFGNLQDLYYFVPCYPFIKTKSDLKKLIRIKRILHESKDNLVTPPTLTAAPSQKQTARQPSAEKKGDLELELPCLKSASFEPDDASRTALNHEHSLRSPHCIEFDVATPLAGIHHHSMQTFELYRRAKYESDMDEISMRWRASLEAIQAGIFECARAERLILGSELAKQAYGEAMQLIYEDGYLDDDGNVSTSAFNQSRLKKSRSEEEYSIENDGRSPSNQKHEEGQGKRSSLLNSLIESQGMISNSFTDQVGSMRSQVVSELTCLRNDLKSKLIEFKTAGDSIMHDMIEAENEIQETWRVYLFMLEMASKKSKLTPTMTGELDANDGPLGSDKRKISLVAGAPFETLGRRGTPLDDAILPSVIDFTDEPSSPLRHTGHDRDNSMEAELEDTFTEFPSPLSTAESFVLSPTFSSGTMSPKREAFPSPRTGLFGRASAETTPKAAGRGGFFRGMSERSLSKDIHSDNSIDQSPRRLQSPVAIVLKAVLEVKDTWLREMFYRTAVHFASQIWDRCVTEMEEIFDTLQNLEAQRRAKIHQEILDFLPRERRFFLGLPAILDPIITDLLSHRVYSEFNSDIIEDSIKKRSELLLKHESKRMSKIMNRSRAAIPDLEELLQTLPGEFFDNGLLAHAKVVERKSGLMGHWRTTLVVVTADDILHLFDCMLFANIERGNWPETAFKELLPTYEMPTSAMYDPMPRESALLKHLIPLASINLFNCTASNDVIDPQVMDINEVVAGRFLGETTRKFTLRTTGREETNRLVEIIKGYSVPQKMEVADETSPDILQQSELDMNNKQAQLIVFNSKAKDEQPDYSNDFIHDASEKIHNFIEQNDSHPRKEGLTLLEI